MKSLIKNILIHVLIFASVGVWYAAWNSTVSDGDSLTAQSWNDLVTQIIDINNKVQWTINSDGTVSTTCVGSC